MNLRPFLYLIIGVFAISCSAILVRLSGTPALIIAFYRQLFSAVMLLPFIDFSEEPLTLKDRFLLTLSGLFLALHFSTWLFALTITSVARATLFVDLQPIWAAVLGWIILKERLNAAELVAISLVTIGGVVSVWSYWGEQNTTSLAGDLLALLGGIAGASYFLIGRGVRLSISWKRYVFSVYAISAAWLLVFCLLWSGRFPVPLERDIPWIILMALIPGIAGHGLFNLAIRYVKSYVVNAAFLGEPVIATILAYLLFAESPDNYFYAGGTVVFMGLGLLLWKQRNP